MNSSDNHPLANTRALEFLKDACRQGRLASAYLFLGPELSGRRRTAVEFAKMLNCADTKDGIRPCGRCSACHRIEQGNYPDVVWIEKPKDSPSIGIEQIRALRQGIGLKPYEGRKKVFVITGAQDMTEEASNALLKTLEEPPLDSVLILLSSALNRMLLTVVSRCQLVKFSPSQAAWHQFRLGETAQRLEPGQFKDKKETIAYLSHLAFWYRDALVVKSGCRDCMIVNDDQATRLKEFADGISFKTLHERIEGILEAIKGLERNANLKLALECLSITLEK